MNEGSYNNVVRSGSPFSPMTPSTPNTYKTNVNRTKTRKWVEAKVQNYDGDDWGNEYEDEYGEPEQEPPATSRIAALRQNSHSQQRNLSQSPATVESSNASGSSTIQSPSSPPSLHIQTGVNPGARPVESGSFAQGSGSASSRFPPRKSSMSQEASDSDAGAAISGSRLESASSDRFSTSQRAGFPGEGRNRPTNAPHIVRPADLYRRVGEEKEKERRSIEPGRPSTDSVYGRNDGAASPLDATRPSIEQRRRTSIESHEGSDTSRNPMQTMPPVEERKSEYGMERLLDQGLEDERRLSTSPKLPDLARVSGFGDDFFSTPGGSGAMGRPSLSPVHDQESDAAGAKLGLSNGPHEGRREPTEPSEGKLPPSTLEGPKLEPNPNILMPPLESDPHKKNKDPTDTSQRNVPLRPQLPGTWVTETISIGSDVTPTGNFDGLGSVSLGRSTNPDASPISGKHAEPADIEPTTTIRHLPSPENDSEAAAIIKDAHESGDNSFNNPTGKHDSTVASKVIAAGPGFHPTPQSLPPLKTADPLAPSGIASKNDQTASNLDDMAPLSSNYQGSPSRSSFAQSSGRNPTLGFPLTAPLNPRRSIIAPEELSMPVTQERKSTMSTVHTASPEKESDKLREEIIKSLSASPAAATPDAGAILGSGRGVPDPVPGSLTRESTYLSGVYDDYLTPPAEEKSLQETGQLLKESMTATNGSDDIEKTSAPVLQRENSFPDIAPLSPRRSPEQQNARLPKRYSWEKASEKITPIPTEVVTSTSELPHDLDSVNKGANIVSPSTELNVVAASPGSLEVQPERPGVMSHQISQVSSLAPGDLSRIESPSPVSFTVDKNTEGLTAGTTNTSTRSSFAEEKEKVLIQSSPTTPPNEQHPALAKSVSSTHTSSPTIQQQAPAAVQPAPQGKIMAFRDILNIASIEQRIDRFDETKAQFYSMDSGLSNWITHMQSQLEQSVPGGQLASPTGAQQQPPTQQPYYQQYLSASSTNPAGPPPPGRSPTAGNQQIYTPTGQPPTMSSSFGSSGGTQVGAKSKELLHAANKFGNKGVKSGMKLFNKGKNKLRGTGDKVFF
ncbi:hypothetical protein GGR53DRAFT_489373 [Hypoxylon sp. FL1150]|nr:hypothetical protein GGR53DRAFT_489373 [Hypoxylon sp. FL1150]